MFLLSQFHLIPYRSVHFFQVVDVVEDHLKPELGYNIYEEV